MTLPSRSVTATRSPLASYWYLTVLPAGSVAAMIRPCGSRSKVIWAPRLLSMLASVKVSALPLASLTELSSPVLASIV